MAARKAWRALKPDYRKRMQSHGLTARNWNTKKGDELRKAARGHAKTPERPTQAAKHPAQFKEYNQRRANEMQALQARKKALFGNRIKYRQRASDNNAIKNPSTGGAVNREYVRRFLRMTPDQVDLIDWTNDEWGFLFYH